MAVLLIRSARLVYYFYMAWYNCGPANLMKKSNKNVLENAFIGLVTRAVPSSAEQGEFKFWSSFHSSMHISFTFEKFVKCPDCYSLETINIFRRTNQKTTRILIFKLDTGTSKVSSLDMPPFFSCTRHSCNTSLPYISRTHYKLRTRKWLEF